MWLLNLEKWHLIKPNNLKDLPKMHSILDYKKSGHVRKLCQDHFLSKIIRNQVHFFQYC